jgi:hypothetical protein
MFSHKQAIDDEIVYPIITFISFSLEFHGWGKEF